MAGNTKMHLKGLWFVDSERIHLALDFGPMTGPCEHKNFLVYMYGSEFFTVTYFLQDTAPWGYIMFHV
jgi:hypothetical protein